MAGPLQPPPATFDTAGYVADAGPSLIWLILMTSIAGVFSVYWLKAIRWARRMDRTSREDEILRALEWEPES